MIVGCLRGKAPLLKVDTFFLDFGPLARCKVERKGFNMYDNNDFRQTLLTRQRHLKMLIERKSRGLTEAPAGKIKVDRARGRKSYYLVLPDGRKKLINESLAKDFIQYSYDLKVIKSASEECEYLNRVLRSYPEQCVENVIDSFSDDRRRLIKPVRRTDVEFVENWLAATYSQKPMTGDIPVFRSDKGDLVRSKSELIIANKLFEAGIPYRYEAQLILEGRILHPDFTILDVKHRREAYWEHFGLMDDVDYVTENLDRLNLYSHNKIYLGERLFITMESHATPLDIDSVVGIISQFK